MIVSLDGENVDEFFCGEWGNTLLCVEWRCGDEEEELKIVNETLAANALKALAFLL